MKRRYFILDVFTEIALSGNPLAVVLDAEDLDQSRMQAIAAEFNLSETVFVLPPANPAHTARARIFTPGRELPFAGHPTIGTAILLAGRRFGTEPAGNTDAVIVLEEGIGPVRCGVVLSGEAGYGLMDVPRRPEPAPVPGPVEAVARALGLRADEIGFEDHLPSAFSAGVPFAFVPLQNLAAAGRAEVVGAHWAEAFAGTGAAGVFCYTRETAAVGRQFHARMFAPGLGIAEDPATGAAVAAFAGVLDRFEALGAGTHRLVIEQGFEMGRPSLIGLEMDVGADALLAVRVGGHGVIVGEGVLWV